MTSQTYKLLCTSALGTAILLAGCQNGQNEASDTPSPQGSATPTISTTAPTAVNGCQLPQSVVDAEHIDSSPTKSDMDANGGIKLKGCIWTTHDGDGFSANVRSTNMTVRMIEKISDYRVAEHLTVDGRQAVTYYTRDQTDLRADCNINVEVRGGGLDILIDNPASNKATGTLDSCEIAKNLAKELIAALPPSA